MKIDFYTAVNRLREMENVLILLHHFPDGDTIGSGYALCRCLQQMGKQVKIQCFHKIAPKYDFITSIIETQNFEAESVVAVDVADLSLFGDLPKDLISNIDLCIDHHASNSLYAKETFLDSSAGANCELIYDIINELTGNVDVEIAKAIYTGIATDTGCFIFSNTSSKTHIIAAKLIDTGIDYADINRIMFDTKSRTRIMIEKEALDNMEFFYSNQCAVTYISNDFLDNIGASADEFEGISSIPRQIEGVIIGITIREKDKGIYKISVRTHDPVDASLFCSSFGGGGHLRAGGCEISGDLGTVRDKLVKKAEEFLK